MMPVANGKIQEQVYAVLLDRQQTPSF